MSLKQAAAIVLRPNAIMLQRLVGIPSVNPEQVADPKTSAVANELRMAEFLKEQFAASGAAEVVFEDTHTEAGRPNVYGVWTAGVANPEKARWVGLDVHTDTVSVEGMTPFGPFDGTVTDDGRLHGRGSCDTKASLANVLALIQAQNEAGGVLQHNLVVAGTVGEETGRLGAGAFKEWLARRGIVLEQLMVAEPTLCKAIYGHKGHVRLKFIIEGTPCHSSQPEHGKNAIVAAAKLVLLLDEEHQRLQAAPPNGLGPATLTTTLIDGGSGINIVPGEASISIDRRVVAGESSEEEAAKLIAMVNTFAAECAQCIAIETVPGMVSYEKGDAFLSDKEDTWIADLSKWSGTEPETATYGTNAGLPYGEPHKTVVVFGPGSIGQAHQKDEWVALDQLDLHYDVLQKWLYGGEAA